MKDRFYIVFNRNGIDRFHKTDRFTTARGEKFAVIDFEVPDTVFEPPPALTARLVMSDGTVSGDARVVLDPHDDIARNKGDFGQRHMNRMAAQLMERALNSTDAGMKSLALDALAICREAGVEVAIELDEAEDQP